MTDVADLSSAFVATLRDQLGADEFAEMQRRNATPEYMESGACASHDFCDANMVMLEAFEATTGRKPLFLNGTDEKGNHTPEQDADLVLWNNAWTNAGPRLRA